MRKPFADGDDQGLVDKLPLEITSVKPQKKRKERYSLFHKSEFLIGVSADTLLSYSLSDGVILTPSLYRQIKKSEEYTAVKDRCYLLLSGRDHSAGELRSKLAKKGFDRELVAQVVDEFSEKGLLNDREFARKFAADKSELRGWGPVKIKNELLKKGVSKEAAAGAVKSLEENLDQTEICVDLALKRKQHFLREDDPRKRKQKIYRYLAGKGYRPKAISKAIPTILGKLNV